MRRFLRPDQHESRNLRQNLPRKVAQPRHFGDVRRRVRRGHCRAKPADPRHILRPGAEIALLSAAVDERGQRQTGLDVERADALRAVDFVSRDRNKVGPERFGLERDFQKALHGVRVEQRQRRKPPRRAHHLRDRHDRAGLVVDHHDGYQNRIGPQRGLQRLDRDEARLIRLQIRHLKALRLQLLHRMQHGVVLHGGRHDVAPALAEALRCGKNGPVVGLGAAGGEKYALCLRAERLRDLRPRRFQPVCRIHARPVDRRRIEPALRQQFVHRGHTGLVRPCRRRIVQINHFYASKIIFQRRSVQKFDL